YIATTDALPNSATSARIHAITAGEVIEIGVMTFATDIFAPDIDLRKTVTDVNGGTLQPGDVLQYTVTGTNTGMDPALHVVPNDVIPTGPTSVPGTITTDGAAMTDATGDDRAEFAGGQIVARLGTSATSTAGGRMNTGATTTLTFRVTVTAMSSSTNITNTAT